MAYGARYEALAVRHRVPDEHGLRLDLAPYTDEEDIARVLDGLRAFTS
ncbi:hypothetical protein [Dactylosporangium sp. NPDC049140]